MIMHLQIEHEAPQRERQPYLLAQSQRTGTQKRISRSQRDTSECYFKSALWTPDGTSILTNSSDKTVRKFVIPPDLLDERQEALKLQPYSCITSAEPVDALAIYPFFDFQSPSSNLVLSAANEQPIRLTSTITGNVVGSYPLINPTTEAFIKPNSTIFASDGTEFLAGSDSLISRFDLSRPGQEPISSLQTGPKKANASTNPGINMRGRISAMSIDPQHNVLAAGTFTRHIGLYDSGGKGDCLGVFSVQGTRADEAISGYGVTQVFWSPCGRYLFIAERKSDGVMFYDIRHTGQLLGWVEGRDAKTNQRMHVDLSANQEGQGQEIWAGGVDGFARVWTKPTQNEGAVKPARELKLDEDAISSIGMHRAGGVLVTASGQRHFDAQNIGNQLKLWAV